MTEALLTRLSEVTQEEQELLQGGGLKRARYAADQRFVVDSGRMLQRGKLIALRPHTRFVDFPAHRHNYVEMIYMCQGKTTHRIDGGAALQLQAGELLLLGCQTEHAIGRAGERDIAVNFLVLPQFFDETLSLIGSGNVLGQFLLGALQKCQVGPGYLHFKVADLLPVQNILENMIWSLVEGLPNSRQINQVSMGLLFLHLLNHTERLEADQGTKTHGLLMEILREVEEHYATASLTTVAKKHHVSVAYLSKLVHRQTGKTYKEVLQEKRIAKAAQLLRSSAQPVTEVIDAVGYANTSFFYKRFKETYGVSPSAYRRAKEVK